MMTSNPLLVSSSAPLKRIVEETESGLVFEAGNSHDFANNVKELYNDKIKCNILGKNGFNSTILNLYNWEVTSVALVNMYWNMSN